MSTQRNQQRVKLLGNNNNNFFLEPSHNVVLKIQLTNTVRYRLTFLTKFGVQTFGRLMKSPAHSFISKHLAK
jgi:hypothetical protein